MERPAQFRKWIIQMTKNPMMTQFTGERIIQRLTEKDLVKVEKIMKKNPSLTITTFLRIFRNILQPTADEDFYLTYGLFRLFQEACLSSRKGEINFNDISTMVTEKMPTTNQEIRLSEKMYPLDLQIPESIKKKIFAPQIIGKVLEERERLEERPYLLDKFHHLNRRVGQTFYSAENDLFISMDYPSAEIRIMNKQFEIVKTLQTELQISKRDSIIICLAWSQHEQRLAVILGNYSISLWAKEDNYRYEVNIPQPINQLANPYVVIGYMESSKLWYAIDNRPVIYILSHYNYEPQYEFRHFNMIKNKETEKIQVVQLRYRRLLCLAFERKIFLVSLEKRELITQYQNFKTSINSISFSETYQALFISNFENYFISFQLSEHVDLTLKGRFEGHKKLITLIGVLENRPVVYSIDEQSVMKLWDIRDFACYQTFYVLKNIEFRQVLALPEAICLVGSKHFCYRWQKYSIYHQTEKVILVTQLEKDILIVTSKQVRIYSHSNGVLMKVVKGIFVNTLIVLAYLIEVRKIILFGNEEGQIMLYSIKDFSIIGSFTILPKPLSFHYEKGTELLTVCCMGEIRICDFKEPNDLPIKRRIHNCKQVLKLCTISSQHDIIAVQYLDSTGLFFYSYERAKPLGFLLIQDLVNVSLVDGKNGLYILCSDKFLVLSYKKFFNSISFFLKKIVYLWQKQDLQLHNISLKSKQFNQIISTDFLAFDGKIIVSSNDALFQCSIDLNLAAIKWSPLVLQKENYNPYRIAVEDHLQAFEMGKPSLLIDQSNSQVLISIGYKRQFADKTFQLLSQINEFYCITDQQQTLFYNQQFELKGCLNIKETLPIKWDLHNYSEQEFNQLEFVCQFIEQEKSQSLESSVSLSTNPDLKASQELITLNKLSPLPSKLSHSTSLREKKMVLDKERDERQKFENYLQMRKGEQLIKLKQINRSTNQKYMSESLAFLNINRNKLLLSKGVTEMEMPQVRALQIKLNASVNRDEKKSMISKYSNPYESPQKKNLKCEPPLKVINSPNELRLLRSETQRQSYRQHIKRLNLTLHQSKFHHKLRAGSLPTIKP